MASAGVTGLQVKRKLKVALMTTGDELVPPGTELQPGQIYNSNFFSLSALLQCLDAEVIDLGVVEDEFLSTHLQPHTDQCCTGFTHADSNQYRGAGINSTDDGNRQNTRRGLYFSD